MTAGAVNIKLGLTVSDVLSGLQTAGSATSQYVSQFKQQFDGLKGSTEAPAGALNSLTRQLAIAKREIGDLVAVGGPIPNSLATRFTVLQNAVTAAKSALNTPIQTTPFAQLNQRLADTKSRMQDILTTGGKVPADLSSKYAQLTQRVDQVNRSFQQTPGLLGKLGISSGALASLSTGLFAASAGFSALQQGLSVASEFQRMNTALKAVSVSTVDFANSQNFLRGISDQYGISIEALSKSYVGFKANTNDTILRGAEAERIFLSITRASAALQLTTEDTTGVLRAFGQMLSKGTVQSEELKGQVGERLYNAFGLAAKAMGVTTQELNKLLQNGQVLAVDLLPKLATQVDKTFGVNAANNVQTMAGGFTRATDQLKLFTAEFSQSSGIDSFFTRIGNGIADTIAGMRELQRQGQGGFLDIIGGLGNFNKSAIAERAARIRTEFATLPQELQRARLEILSEQVDKMTTQEQVAFIPLLKQLRDSFQASRREARRLADSTATNVTGGFDIDKARTDQAALAKQIQNIRGDGGTVPVALQARYDKLTAQIERATETTKKQRVAHEAVGDQLSTNERILKRLTLEYKRLGDNADGARSKQIALVSKAVEDDKVRLDLIKNPRLNIGDIAQIKVGQSELVNPIKPVVLGVELSPVLTKTSGSLIKTIIDNTLRVGTFFPGLFDKNDIKLPTLTDFQKLLPGVEAYENKFNAISQAAREFSVRGLVVPQSAIDSLATYAKTLRGVQDSDTRREVGIDNKLGGDLPQLAVIDRIVDRLQNGKNKLNLSVQDVVGALDANKQFLVNSTSGFLTGIGESIGKGGNPLKTALQAILNFLGDYAIRIGTAALISSKALLIAAPFLAGATLPQGIGLQLAGGGLILAGGLVKGLAATGFANGGLVTGSVFANVGEGRGTSISNPELIMPVDRLNQYLDKRGSRGVQTFIPDARIEGKDIVISFNRTNDSNGSYF